MNFIPDIILKWLIVVSLTLLSLFGSSSTALQSQLKSTACDSKGGSFEEGYVYTYDYTVKTSSAFLGASSSKAGSRLTCTVIINVPLKCEHVMQLSNCKLSERHRGVDDIYTEILDASKFLQDLERYLVYFQMNTGKLHLDSIFADDRETLQVLNIKRGIISAFQFPILEKDEYINQTTKTDIFGECPVQYHVFGDDLNQIESRRKISQCILPNVHAKQVNLVSGPSIGQMTGGFVEEPITEMMYPFETVVSCLHVLDEEKKPSAISCLQKHYFEPLTNQGDPLLTAMTNISQDLKLSHVVENEIVTQSQMYDGMSLKNIKFEFGDEFYRSSTLMQLHESLFALGEKFVQSRKKVEIETIPGMFGNLVQSFRSANHDTLKDLMVEVFDCTADCTDKAKVAAQVFFLDGLESCGTDACILTFLLCMNQDHTTRFQTAAFIHGLKDIHVSENILSELHKYCIKSDETQCWLTLGSILSKSSLSDLKEGSTLYKVLESSNAILDDNCKSHSLHYTERKLNTVVKTAKNIGYILNMAFLSKSPAFLEFPAKIEKCLHNPVIPNTVKISLIQFVEDSIEVQNFRDLSRGTVDALFSTLEDVTMDSTIRALSFSILTKTTDKKTIQSLVKFMLKNDNTDQMKTYMTSTVKSLFEDDSPDLKEVRASWGNVRKEEYFNPYFPRLDSYAYWSSKHIGAASFYKLPVTDIFGGQVAADLIYDPSSSIFSTLRTKFNFYYGEKKYRLFECMVRIKGFDMLLHVILKRINMSYQEMYALYKDLKSRARSNSNSYNEQFANFQADIVNAVKDILSEVNHSHELDFDFFVEIAVKGKDVAFISLKELISAMERIQSTLPPNVSIFQAYLRKLFEKISFNTFKSKEVMSIVRDIPTCAGLPLNMTVNAYGTHIIDSSLQSDLLLYLAKKSPTLSASVNPSVSLVHEVRGVLAVPFGIAHSSGMEERILFGTETDVELSFKLGYNDPKVLVENPSKKKLVLEVKPVRKDIEGQSQRLFYVRGVMQLHHFSGAETVQRQTTDVSHRVCSHDSWIAVIFRKKMCMNLAYPDVMSPRANVYFLLTGPFDLDVSVEDLDGTDFPVHKWTLEYEQEKQAGAGYIDNIYITHDGIVGEQISRKYGYVRVMYVRDDCSVTISSHIPELHYTFNANFTNNWKGRMFEFTVAEVLKRYGSAVSAFVFKLQGNNYGERKEFKYHWNVTTPDIGWDVQFVASGKGDFPNFVDKSAEISLSYYCTKNSILYMLHMIPSLAMENHDISKFYLKSSSHSLEGESQKTVAVIQLYGRELSVDCVVEKMGPATKAHAVMTYKVNGITKTATSDFVWTWGQSDAGLTLDLSSDLTSSDFSIDATGSCTASQTDVTLSGDIYYQNTAEENLLKREKRFMKIAYEKLRKVEEATVNNVMKIKKKMFGTSEKDMQATEKENGELQKQILNQLQDSDTLQTSIWDYQKWHANVVFSATIVPVYGENVKVAGQSPEGMKAIGALRIKHPWNGGYIQHMKNFTIGKNMQNTFRDFKFWFSGILTTAFVRLDGTPFLDGKSPVVITRQGGFVVKREAGKLFYYNMSYHGPDIDKEYFVSFNWDAFDHNEPLIHVKSDETNLLLPFLNHHYEETLFYEARHVKHAMSFSHELVKFNIETDISTFRGIAVTQNGSVTLQLKVLAKKWLYEFRNKAENGKLECAIFPSSTPNTIVIFSLEFVDSTSVFLKKAVKEDEFIAVLISNSVHSFSTGPYVLVPRQTAETDNVHMWSTEISLKGSSMIKVTQTWSEAYQKNMKNSLKQELISMAMSLQAVGDQQMSNIDIPLLDQPILFISTTPRDIIKLNIMPNIMSGISFWCRLVGNLVPVRYNPSRYNALLQAIDTVQDEEPDPTVRKIQYLIYLGMKTSGKFLEAFGKSSTYLTRIEDILTKKQYSYVFSTNPFIFKRITDVPGLAQHGKHFAQPIKEIFGLAVRYNKDKTILQQSSTSVAVLFGRHDPYRELNVQTFDGSFFEIPAEETAECSFMLASDLRQRRWSLVLTTAGVTLLTPSQTITVGWNKNIYLDNCKTPSAKNLIQSQDGKVTVERKDGRIYVDTTLNLNLEFDTIDDICLITVEGPYRNETIGLLGTNDREKVTDFRMRDGYITSDINELLAEYVLSGQKTSVVKNKEILRKESDGCEEEYEQCVGLFQEHYSPMYKCFNTGTNFPYNHFCENAALRCEDHDTNFCYGLKALKDICSKKGLLDKPISLKGICQSQNRVSQGSKANSLDIVFVVSQHVEMMAMRDSSVEYVFELTNIDAWKQLDNVRLGVVLFGESRGKVTLQRNGNCLLCERDNYDWERLFDETETKGGSLNGDAFEAIKEATTFPFNPVAHKMIVVLMTKKQSSRHTQDLDNIKVDLQEKGITLNVVSTYIKTRSRRILGINWNNLIISHKPGYNGQKSLPKNDYCALVTATRGALWDLISVFEDYEATSRMVEELVAQTKTGDHQLCQAA